ncbi:thioredoxin family protein [Pseudomonas putida]|uniref:thioredoxin family protein n=1 Tax=Pseudomonas putida TaxID=303 RepID=UPI002363BBFD|nr:thioredoxin family protein [Pseudomonas putida]MDD1966052.1 thioredoxin family protein [Pseudomonas putida]
MASYKDLFEYGEHFESFVARGFPAEIAAIRDMQHKLAEQQAISLASQQRLLAVQATFHLLVVGEMWCPDCQINIAVMDYLQRGKANIDLAIISKGRAENELKQRLDLERISIPLVLVLDEQFEPVGRFVESPQVVIEGGDAVKADYRAGKYLESTLQDFLAIFEESAQG